MFILGNFSMKKLSLFILALLTLTLVACSSTHDVMNPLSYHGNSNIQSVPHKAYLYWQPGKEIGSEVPRNVDASSVAALVISASIDQGLRSANPSDYVFNYGKAQEAVFMTSLKNVLNEQHTFIDTQLTTTAKTPKPQDVLISVYFKKTEVLPATLFHQIQIVLDVEMTIKQGGKKPYTRSYQVKSHNGALGMKSFKGLQTDVSTQLMDKIMADIANWSKRG